MNIKNPLIEWYIHRFLCLVQRERCTGMIKTARLVHHIFIESRRYLVRLTIVHRPHRPNHRMEPSQLHRRREMDHFVLAFFVSDSRMTRREIRKLWILQIAPDDVLDRKVSITQSECGLERLLRI